MKRVNYFIALSLVAAITLVSCNTQKSSENNTESTKSTAAGEQVTVDLALSSVHWKGEMLGLYSHEGDLKLKSASLELNNGAVSGGSFVADMTTMVPTDENYMPSEGRTPEKLVGHLSAPDFFDVATYPEASFTISSVSGSTATGTLTVRGISHEETVTNIEVVPGESGTLVSGVLTFDRKKYDVAYETKMKDMVLSNDISLKITLYTEG